jgi:hypothetical protein
MQTARYVKITQTGTGSSAWRIQEFYIMNTYIESTAISKPVFEKNDVNVWFSGDQLQLTGTNGTSLVKIYSVSGQQVTTPVKIENSYSVNLPTGIYIAIIQNQGNIYKKKLIKK